MRGLSYAQIARAVDIGKETVGKFMLWPAPRALTGASRRRVPAAAAESAAPGPPRSPDGSTLRPQLLAQDLAYG